MLVALPINFLFHLQHFLLLIVAHLKSCRQKFLGLFPVWSLANQNKYIISLKWVRSLLWVPCPGFYSHNIILLQQPSAWRNVAIEITMNLSTFSTIQRKSWKTPNRNVIFYVPCSSFFFHQFCKRSGFV